MRKSEMHKGLVPHPCAAVENLESYLAAKVPHEEQRFPTPCQDLLIRAVEPGRGAGCENQWGFFPPGKGGSQLENQVLSERTSAQDLVLSHPQGFVKGR